MEPQHRKLWQRLAEQSFNLPGDHHLRALTATDASAVLASVDDHVVRWLPAESGFTHTDAQRLTSSLAAGMVAEGRGAMWGITDGSDRVRGVASVHAEAGSAAALSIWLGPQSRGRGLASAAVRTIAEATLAEVDLSALLWRTLVGNVAALRVARAAGFTPVGTWPTPVGPEQELHPAWWAVRRAGDEPPAETLWAQCLVEIAAGGWQLQPIDERGALLAEALLPVSACVPAGVWVAREITTARADAVVALLVSGERGWVISAPVESTPAGAEAAAGSSEVIDRYARRALGLTTP